MGCRGVVEVGVDQTSATTGTSGCPWPQRISTPRKTATRLPRLRRRRPTTHRRLRASGATTPGDSIAQRIAAFADGEHARVVAAVTLCCGSTTEAADAVVDALGHAWERLDAGEPIDNLAAWVTRAATNQVRSRFRHLSVVRRTRHLVAHDDLRPDPADREHRPGRPGHGRSAGSPSANSRCWRCTTASDLPVAEVAAQLGVAAGTVKATLHQAHAALAEQLGTDLGGASDD